MQKIDQDKIVILDFGSQYTQLIARRIREIGVLSEIVSCEIAPKELLNLNPKGIIFSGGPESVNECSNWWGCKTGIGYGGVVRMQRNQKD